MPGKHRAKGRANRNQPPEKPQPKKGAKHAAPETEADRRADAVGDTARERDDAVRLIPPPKGKHHRG